MRASSGQDFWARRRAGVAAEAKAEQAAAEAQTVRDEQAAYEDMSEAEVLEALKLPDPDSLRLGDDFTAFMAKAVPDQIRRRALRVLWRSNPVLANVDMLVDYGEDFTDSAMAVENIQTAYQVGKGMLKHVQEMARQAEEAANPSAPEAPEPDVPLEIASDQETPENLAADNESAAPEAPFEAAMHDEPLEDDPLEIERAPTPPRRMKFRIEETA